MTTKTWGPITWYFLHSFLEKIPDDIYQREKVTIINYILSICSNLPCESCTEHATTYLKPRLRVQYFNNISSLKTFMYNFHNEVNKRTKKPIFTDFNIYKRSKFIKIYELFRQTFLQNTVLSRKYNGTMFRKHIIKNIDNFVNKYINYFRL